MFSILIVESIPHKTNSPDVNQLRQQYKKIKQRNKQVQIITQCNLINFYRIFNLKFSFY